MSGYFDHHQQVQYGLPFWSPTPTKSDLAHHVHGPSFSWPVMSIASGSSQLILTLRANQGQYRAENRHNQASLALMGVGPAVGDPRFGNNWHRQC